MRRLLVLCLVISGIVLTPPVVSQANFGFGHRRQPVCPPVCPPLYCPPLTPTVPKPSGLARQVRAILIVDDKDPSLGADADFSGKRVRQTLEAQIEPSRRQITAIVASQAPNELLTQAYIEERVREALAGVAEDEAVFCYYAGHGQLPQGKPAELNLRGDRGTYAPVSLFSRPAFVKLLTDNPARLKVVLTDSCMSYIQLPQARRTEREPATAGGTGPQTERTKVLESLLLGHKGLVDVNACKEGESAFYTQEEGGLFTASFIELANEVTPETYYGTGLTWDYALDILSKQTNRRFETMREKYRNSADASAGLRTLLRDQSKQTIKVFDFTAVNTLKDDTRTGLAERAADRVAAGR